MKARPLRLIPIALALSGVASAQTAGTIIGVVTDASTGKPVAGALVIATSPNLQGEQTAMTDEAGKYRLGQLPPGPYKLVVQLTVLRGGPHHHPRRRPQARARTARRRPACAPARHPRAVSAGVPVTVLLAPVIPALNDHEIEALVEAAAAAGASNAAFMPLRLPHELGALFEQWLREHYRARADRVLNLLRDLRGGRLNDPRFGHRMRGEGPYAALLAARFAAACRRHGLGDRRAPALDCSQFVRDPAAPAQGDLFG